MANAWNEVPRITLQLALFLSPLEGRLIQTALFCSTHIKESSFDVSTAHSRRSTISSPTSHAHGASNAARSASAPCTRSTASHVRSGVVKAVLTRILVQESLHESAARVQSEVKAASASKSKAKAIDTFPQSIAAAATAAATVRKTSCSFQRICRRLEPPPLLTQLLLINARAAVLIFGDLY